MFLIKPSTSFQEALAVAKDNLQAQVNIALTYMDQKLYDKAVVEFEKALAMDDEDVSARAGLCEALLALGDTAMSKSRMKEAVQAYRRVLAINTEHTEARGRMGELSSQRAEKALSEGKNEEALSAFGEALHFTPENQALIARVKKVREQNLRKILGNLLARSGKEESAKNWDGAIKILEEALSLEPDDASIQNKIDNAKTAQEQARQAALLASAEAAVKSARWDEAIESLTSILAVKPNEEIEAKLRKIRAQQQDAKLSALKTQAQGLARAERFDEALAAWTEYLSHKPEDQKEVEEIVMQTRKIAKLAGDYAEAQEEVRKKHFGRAIELLQGIIAQDPAYKATTRLLVEAVQANKAIPFWRKSWMFGILGVAALAVLGVFFGPTLWGTISTARQQTPPAEETLRSIPTLPADLIFLEPILAHMADTSPDFEDKFSNTSASWEQIAEGIAASDLIADGALNMALLAGTPTEKLVLSSPSMKAGNFGVEYDFFIEESAGGTTLGMGFPSIGVDPETINFDVDIDLEFQKWFIGLTDNSIATSGKIGESLQGKWSHLQLIYAGSRAVVFLNGELLDHAEGIGKSGDVIWIYANTAEQAKIRFDNVKFWNIDSLVDSTPTDQLIITAPATATALPTVTAPPTLKAATPMPAWVTDFAEPILASIAGRDPNIDAAFNSDDIKDFIKPNCAPGKSIIYDGEMLPGGCHFSWTMWYTDFVIELDYRFLPTHAADDKWTIYFRGIQGFDFYSRGEVKITNQSPGIPIAYTDSEMVINHVLIIVKGEAVALYINDQPVYYSALPPGYKNGEASWTSQSVAYDNFKIWNLNQP